MDKYFDGTYEKITDIQVKNYNKKLGNTDYSFFCEKCKNKGLVAVKVFRNNMFDIVLQQCDCVERLQAEQSKEQSGLKDNFGKFTFENFDTSKEYAKTVLEKAKENVPTNDWFFIGGQIGSGKTHICTAISERLLMSATTVKFVSWRDLMSDLKNGFSGRPTFFDFETFKKTEVLYLDDFLHGKATDFEIEKAFEIIDYRYRNSKKTIISSEMLSSEILQLSQSIGSRIIEKSKGFVCNIKRDTERNYRLSNNNQKSLNIKN